MATSSKDWLTKTVNDGAIKCYSDEDIIDRVVIGRGGYGLVYKAKVKHSGISVAMKTLFVSNYGQEEELYSDFVRELKNHKQVDDHPNIIRFLGLCKDPSGGFHMVFEFADGGTLRDHLIKNFKRLTWRNKYRLGLDITNGLKYLHNLEIIHKDMSSSNVLIQRGVAKITDFGLSSVLKQRATKSKGAGCMVYLDPLSFMDTTYRRGKESDVFSLGVILWEISSAMNPCGGCTEVSEVISFRINRLQDDPFPGTHQDYIDLYSECLTEDFTKRPSCEQIYKRLEVLFNSEDSEGQDQYSPIEQISINNKVSQAGSVTGAEVSHQYEAPLMNSSRAKYEIPRTWLEESELDRSKTRKHLANLDDQDQQLLEKRYEEALNHLNESLIADPDNASLLKDRGSIYRILKQYNNALKDLNKSLELEPDDAFALKQRGAVYRALKKTDDALKDLNRSIELEPEDAFALTSRGVVYHALADYDRAKDDLTKSFNIDPTNTYTLTYRGQVLRRLNRKPKRSN